MSKSSNYWRKREREWKKADLKDEAEYIQEIQDIYSTMLTQINKEIESFFVRYSNKEGMSMAEAKRKASDIDIKEYEKKAKKYVKEKDFSKEANEQMRLYNLAMKVNRLELLKANIGLELTAGSDELVSFTKEKLEGAALKQIQRNAGILGDTIVDNAKTAKTIANSSFKNATFSERIWSQQDLLKNDLYGILSTALIQGRNPREFIPKVRKSFDVTRYQAERLLRTELTRVRIQAQAESYEANGIDEYEYVACGLKDVCPICKVLDKQIFKLKDMEIGENAPPMHPNCVVPDTEIIAPDIEAITKSDYSGDVIKFVTANGRNLTVTPNHIVPTSRGWIRAKNLVKGDKVFCYRGCIENGTVGTPTDNNRTATIENLFASIIETQGSATSFVPAASVDLKGDVIPNSKINIVFVNGELRDKINALMSKFISDSFLIGTGETRESVLSRDGSLSKLLIRIGLAFDGFMGRFDKGSVFFRSSATSRDLISLRRTSDYDARLFKYSVNNAATDFILIGNSQATHAGSVISDNGNLINLSLSSVNRNSQSNSIFNENFFNSFSSLMDNSRYLSDTFTTLIEIDDIIDIQRCSYSGHVYDASSLSTLYIANGIVTSNCHCSTAPYSDRKVYEQWLNGLANGDHDLRFDEWKDSSGKMAAELKNDWSKTETRAFSKKEQQEFVNYAKEKGINLVGVKNFDGNPELLKQQIDSLRYAMNKYPLRVNKKVSLTIGNLQDEDFASTSDLNITLNKKILRNKDISEKNIVNDGKFASPRLQDIVIHEYGHALSTQYGYRGVEIAKKAYYNLYRKELNADAILEYLDKNISGYCTRYYGNREIDIAYNKLKESKFKEITSEILAKNEWQETSFTQEYIRMFFRR